MAVWAEWMGYFRKHLNEFTPMNVLKAFFGSRYSYSVDVSCGLYGSGHKTSSV